MKFKFIAMRNTLRNAQVAFLIARMDSKNLLYSSEFSISSLCALRYMYNSNSSLSLSCAKSNLRLLQNEWYHWKLEDTNSTPKVLVSPKKYSDLHVLLDLCNYDI